MTQVTLVVPGFSGTGWSLVLVYIHTALGRLRLETLYKKSNLEIQKNSFSRLGAKLWNERPTKLRTLSKHKFKFNIRASLLDILKTGDIYHEIDEIILKMKKGEPCNFFVILSLKKAS